MNELDENIFRPKVKINLYLCLKLCYNLMLNFTKNSLQNGKNNQMHSIKNNLRTYGLDLTQLTVSTDNAIIILQYYCC